jgi:hypothetical protein
MRFGFTVIPRERVRESCNRGTSFLRVGVNGKCKSLGLYIVCR